MKENKASSTAFTVLQGVLYTSEHPLHSTLVSKELKEASLKLINASNEGKRRLRQLHSWWFKPMVPIVEKLLVPGLTLHYVLRKNYIEEYTLKAINEGVTQVINLGAGFDTLAYRLSKKFQDVNFIEVDHPATHKIKSEALFGIEESYENLHFVSVDFTKQKLEEELGASKFLEKDAKTLFIVEGVIMYLNADQIEELFNSLHALVNNEVSAIFTAIEDSTKSSKSYGPLLSLYLKIKDEPLNWTCNKENIANFLEPLHYELIEIASATEFKKRFITYEYGGDVHDGEYIAVAKFKR